MTSRAVVVPRRAAQPAAVPRDLVVADAALGRDHLPVEDVVFGQAFVGRREVDVVRRGGEERPRRPGFSFFNQRSQRLGLQEALVANFVAKEAT